MKLLGVFAGYALYCLRKMESEKKLCVCKLHDIIVKYRRQWA